MCCLHHLVVRATQRTVSSCSTARSVKATRHLVPITATSVNGEGGVGYGGVGYRGMEVWGIEVWRYGV